MTDIHITKIALNVGPIQLQHPSRSAGELRI